MPDFLNGLLWGLLLAWLGPKAIRFAFANPAMVKGGFAMMRKLIFKR